MPPKNMMQLYHVVNTREYLGGGKYMVSFEGAKKFFERAYTKLALPDSEGGMVEAAIAIAIGLIVLVAIFSIAPVIGDSIDNSISIDTTSQWNSSVNTDLPTGVDIWTTNASMLGLAVMISILALVIFTIMRLRGGGGQY